MAKKVLQSIERDIHIDLLDAVGGEDPKPVNLTFKGFKSMQKNNPAKTRIGFLDIVKDEHFATLERIISLIISTFLDKGVTTQKELSHVSYDESSKMWKLD